MRAHQSSREIYFCIIKNEMIIVCHHARRNYACHPLLYGESLNIHKLYIYIYIYIVIYIYICVHILKGKELFAISGRER